MWDVTDKKSKKSTDITEVGGMDVAREVTESNPGSPLNYPIAALEEKTVESEEQDDITNSDNPYETLVLVCKDLFT